MRSNANQRTRNLGDGGSWLYANVDRLSMPAPVHKLHRASDLGEKRIVLAAPDVLAGLDLRAALADQNRAA